MTENDRRISPRDALFRCAVAAGILLAAVSCTTKTYITPMAVAQPNRVDFSADQSLPADVKTFTLPADWQYGTWVVKKGATIQFNRDGTGEFSAVIFSQHVGSPDELHFQSVQYGIDQNVLFTFPGSEVGLRMGLRESFRDFPYETRFGFDPRLFDSIVDVKFLARLRLNGDSVGEPLEAGTSKVGYSTTAGVRRRTP